MAVDTQQDDESTQVLEFIVIGLSRAGKTTFIKTISQRTEWEKAESEGWLFGRLPVGDGLTVHFLEPPARAAFDFIWLRELVSETEAEGYIVLIDSGRPDLFGEAVSVLQTIRVYHPETPVVVAANKQDADYSWNPSDIRYALGIPQEIPVLPCVSSDVKMVKETVLQLLYRVFGEG